MHFALEKKQTLWERLQPRFQDNLKKINRGLKPLPRFTNNLLNSERRIEWNGSARYEDSI